LIDIIKEKIWHSLKALKLKAPPKSKINVEYPKHKIHGDYSSNIALNLAKKIRRTPMTLAKKLATHLSSDPLFSEVTAAKPGFINFHIANKILYSTLQDLRFYAIRLFEYSGTIIPFSDENWKIIPDGWNSNAD